MTGIATAQDAPQTKIVKSGHILASGVNYYYEIHGNGEPMLLLHGGLGSINMFLPSLPAFAKERTVIAVDLQGHGRTTLGDRPIRMESIGDDMDAILDQLGYGTVDAVGYSFGAGVAFRLAVQHPARVRRLALISAGFAQDGFYPEMLPQQALVGAAVADAMKETPMYTSYAAVAPRPQDFPKLLDRMGEFMRQPYDYTEDVKRLTQPTLLVFGDNDMFTLDHIIKFYKLLGGGQRDAGWMRENMAKNRLAILPDVTHYDMSTTPLLGAVVLPFINGASNAPSQAGS